MTRPTKPAPAAPDPQADRAGRPGSGFKALYRKLERTLDRIERFQNPSVLLESIVEILVIDFKAELGFESGRVYERVGADFVLCCVRGSSGKPVAGSPIGYRVPRNYPAHVRTLREGLLIMHPGEPDFDSEIERAIGVTSTFAAIAVGRGNTHVLAFSIKGEAKEENILYSLSAVRHVVNLKLEQDKLAGVLEESRIIQESLLPSSPPIFDGYDVDGLSRPTEIVGGDLFDFLPLSDRLLGVAIADASGHGLPAALMARDVVTGLRVGMDEDLKVVRVVERLNRVIHRATLSSRFISLFYGEFDTNGTLIYCNAGHNPPLLRGPKSFEELDRGGLILGPNPNARYERGHVRLQRGDAVVMYTDGLIERANPRGEEFGVNRLRRLLRKIDGASARETVERLFSAADEHAGGARQVDDVTVVVVRKI
jgi:serine phosphatase RsbU (regulator of sigma subunit)